MKLTFIKLYAFFIFYFGFIISTSLCTWKNRLAASKTEGSPRHTYFTQSQLRQEHEGVAIGSTATSRKCQSIHSPSTFS